MQKYTRIGIVVPTAPEREPLIKLLEQVRGQEIAVVKRDLWPIHQVQLGELLVSIIHSGIGMVNTGAATEALVIYEQPQIVLNYGIAGAHTHEALPGDIIIATQVCAPFNGYLREGGVLDSAFGIQWDEEVEEDYHRHVKRQFSHLPCDPALVTLALQASEVLIEQHALAIVAPPGQEERPARIFSGVMASADTYCQDGTTFAHIRETFGSLGEDMESAAVGQIATRHALPFAIIRCLSNNDLLEVLTQERKRVIYPEMMRRAALVTVRLLQMLSRAR
jgi:nucleoside phosphorylase